MRRSGQKIIGGHHFPNDEETVVWKAVYATNHAEDPKWML